MDTIIPESTEQEVSVEQENATFFVLGDAAYTSEIIEEYNRNAENKTNEFNSNSDAKVKEYNANATNKTTAFDNNYDTKVAAFNKNAETQTETFNSNATTQVNSFNANATTSIQNYNANAEQKLYEFNANALAYEEGIKDNSNRVKRLETDIFDSGTASGSLINIQDSTLAEFQELTVDGVSKQEIRSGKNLAFISSIVPYNYSAKLENGIITMNGTSTSAGNLLINLNDKTNLILKANTTYTFSIIVAGTITGSTYKTIWIKGNNFGSLASNKTTSFQYTPTEDEVIAAITFDLSANLTFDNCIIKIQVEEGITSTEYEAYGATPTPEIPSPIDVIDEIFEIGSCGKNLLSQNDGEFTLYKELYIKPISVGKYKISGNITSTDTNNELCLLSFRSSDNTEVAKLNVNRGDFSNTFTLSKEIDRINIYASTSYENSVGDTAIFKNLMVSEDGGDYEPYQEAVSTITLPDGEFAADGDLFRIAFNNEDGKYHLWLDKNINKKILNGSESWGYQNTKFVCHIDGIKQDEEYHINILIRCNYYKGDTTRNRDEVKVNGIAKVVGAHTQIAINDTRFTTTDEFKTWLAENPITIYYQLAEPYTLDLGSIDMPLSYYPTTNVFTTHDLQPLINVMYYRDIKNTITTMQTDIETLKEAVATLTVSQTNLASEVDLLQEQTETESEVIE